MVIDDDDMVKFFMELHKKHFDETVYPLLVSFDNIQVQNTQSVGECSRQDNQVKSFFTQKKSKKQTLQHFPI